MTTLSLFTYGPLMHPMNMEIHEVAYREVEPVVLVGFQRFLGHVDWTTKERSSSIADVIRADDTLIDPNVGAATVRVGEGQAIVGVLYTGIPEDNLTGLNEEEVGLERTKLSQSSFTRLDNTPWLNDESIFIYSANPTMKHPEGGDVSIIRTDVKPNKEYVHSSLIGAESQGILDKYIETTFLADRTTKLRTWLKDQEE